MSTNIVQGIPNNKIPDLTLGEFFFQQSKKYSNNIAQIDGDLDKSETYSNLNLRSIRLALNLTNLGITPNDIILSCSGNNLDCTVTVFATCYLGAKIANLDPRLSQIQTTHLINLLQPKIIFVEEKAVNLIETAKHSAKIIVYGQTDKYIKFSELTTQQNGEENFQPVKVDVNSISVMFFSSGTTGLPKAVCHSHKSMLNLFYIFEQSTPFSNGVLYFSTFYWISAMSILGYCALTGAKRIMSQNPQAENIFQLIQKYKIESLFLAPIFTYGLTSFPTPEKYNTSSLKVFITGGTPLSQRQVENIKKTLPSTYLIFLYALTEIGLVSIFNPKTDSYFMSTKIGSCGLVAPGLSAKVVDLETRQTLGPNQKGEICLKGPTLMIGYYNSTDNNNIIIDKDGYLKTGDIGYYDNDNCFYVIERIKEMFKYKSWHIVPSVLEAVLLEHENVWQAVIFGTPLEEEELGDVPTAHVVLKPNCTVTEEELVEFVNGRVADYEKLRGGVVICQSLLRTATGKVMRKEIRENHIKQLKNNEKNLE